MSRQTVVLACVLATALLAAVATAWFVGGGGVDGGGGGIGGSPNGGGRGEGPAVVGGNGDGGRKRIEGPPDPSVITDEKDIPKEPPKRGPDGRWSYVWLHVVDLAAGSGLDGVTVFDAPNKKPLGNTSPTGWIALRNKMLPELAFVKDGYLVVGLQAAGEPFEEALAAMRKGREVTIRMVDDRFTLPLEVLFVDAAKKPVGGVRFRMWSLSESPVSSLSIPRSRLMPGERIPSEIMRAWTDHVRYTRYARLTPEQHNFGLESRLQDYLADAAGRASLRMIAAGRYGLVALSPSGARTRAEVSVGPLKPLLQEIALGPGLTMAGRVLAADDRGAVEGAEVSLTPPQLMLGPATTDASGAFRFTGLAEATVSLDVRAPGFDATSVGPFRAGAKVPTVFLQRKRTITWNGEVLEKGTNRAVAGARVSVFQGATVATDARGRFTLRCVAGEQFTLRIERAGYLAYGEAIDLQIGQPPPRFLVVPADAEGQLRAKLIARVSGHVVDRNGKAIAGALVDVRADPPRFLGGIAGRSILTGGFADHPPRTQTDAKGRFTLLTRHSGLLVVTTYDNKGQRIERKVSVAPGGDHKGLTIRVAGG